MRAIIKAPFVRRIEAGLSADDQALVAAAALPELHEITPELLHAVQNTNGNNMKVMLQGAGIFGAVCIISIIAKAYYFSFSVGTAALLALLGAWLTHLRGGIDETASVMELPVHHFENNRAVCYLPDGKYLFRLPKNENDPASVTVITCGSITTCKFNRKAEES